MTKSRINKTIPVEVLQNLIVYDNGDLYWNYREDKTENWNDKFAGKKIKTFLSNGYLRFNLRYNGKSVKLRSHVVAWTIVKNKYPDICLDHINNVRSDNRIENLREVNFFQNCLNALPSSNSSSQYKGIYYSTHRNKWVAEYKFNRVKHVIGGFIDEIDAATAYNEKILSIHDPEFLYLNDISNGYTNKEYPNKPRGWKPE